MQPSQINSVQDITSYMNLRRTPNSGSGPSRTMLRLNKPALQNVHGTKADANLLSCGIWNLRRESVDPGRKGYIP
ncbi:MAG TPA: hypothetical protein VJX72_01305 [Candidatus Acidoferrum sp.]|nr:hypothetical protein [Candidatus Acidoferrum sp.]